MEQKSIILLGRPGSGKGTQARLLVETLAKKDPSRKILHIEPGAKFRKFMQGESFTAKHAKHVVEKGWLMPEFMPIYIWSSILVDRFEGNQHIIFDGAARKIIEAQALESVFPFYGLPKPIIVHLDIHHEESVTRLVRRSQLEGRKDDDRDAIERRRIAFETEAQPTIEYYRTNPGVTFLDIDGTGTIEEVHARVVKAIGL